jgi:hypothetical protein
MVWKFDIKDTKGVPLSNEKLTEKLGWNPQTSGNYWELWKVNEKGKFDPSNIDVWKGAPWPGTKGTITIVGSASFYPFGKLFPSGFADYQPSPAGTLLWTMTDPGLRNGRGRVSRTLVATWDCTCGTEETQLSTSLLPVMSDP